VTIAVHWTTVALVTGLFTAALLLGHAKTARTAETLLTLHRSLGVATWTLTASRLVWRMIGATFPPFPDSMPPAQRHAARLSEYSLYILLLVQPLTGLAQSLFLGNAFILFAWSAPVLVTRDLVVAHLFYEIHKWGALTLAGLIGLHACAGLLHAFVLKDGVFQHMWPFKPRGSRGKDWKRADDSSPSEGAPSDGREEISV
jgi:cytochrome b561